MKGLVHGSNVFVKKVGLMPGFLGRTSTGNARYIPRLLNLECMIKENNCTGE